VAAPPPSRSAALTLLLALLALGLAWGCRSSGARPAPAGVAGLIEGPTRWLMLPEEEREVRRLRTTREVIDFIEAFWRRRDPDPLTPDNELSKVFYERVEAADRLYSEEGQRGSLTDRGRALVLLGPPPVLRYNQKRVPTLEPGLPGQVLAPVQSRTQSLETWVYPRAGLPPRFLDLLRAWLGEDPQPAEVVLTFSVGTRQTALAEGEKYLELAARASVREPR
jgi:GWxTD domain-containing protein